MSWILQPPHLFQKKKAESQPSLVLSCLTAFYRDINAGMLQFRMPRFYRVLVFYLCLKKLDHNEQGICVFYREGKSRLKCVLERGLLGKRGAGSPKGNQENGEGFVAVAGGSRARNPTNTVVTGWGGSAWSLCWGIDELVQVILCVWTPEGGK